MDSAQDSNPVISDVTENIVSIISKVTIPAVDSADLTVWADVISALEEIEQECAQGCTTVSGIISTIRVKIEEIILEESQRTAENFEFITKSLEILQSLDPQEARQQIERIAYLIPDTGDVPEDDQEEDDIPEMGGINIDSDEDFVVYNEFTSESTEHLERIENSVLNLEEYSSRETVDDIFRCFHSIKGAAGFLGLIAMNRLCHECEGILDRLRKNTLTVTSDVVDALLTGIDLCRRILDSVSIALEDEEKHYLPPVDIRGALAKLKWAQQQALFVEGGEPDPTRIGGALLENGVIDQEDLAGAIMQQRRPLGKILVDMGAASSDDIDKAVSSVSEQKPKTVADSIKVDTSRLDRLMEMVGELVIAQSQVKGDPELVAISDHKLVKNIEFASKLTSNLQELVMALRLVPLRGIFNRMQRLVRDTAQKTGKHVNFLISGEDTEIDKTLSENLSDPLVHLLRNAVDHGVETPDKRLENGKSEHGTVKLRAFHAGGNVVIEIEDDGNGINAQKVLEKALSKGLVQKDAKLEDPEIFDLIFLPGFSTKDQATDISGRGVGMDVVKKNISALGGRVDVNSWPGKGSVFSIRLPLTMAIVDGMIVGVANQKYVLPTLSIEEAFRPKPGSITSVRGGTGKGVMVRGRMVPLVSLSKVFDLRDQHEQENIEDCMVVVVHDDYRSCGLVINEMLSQQQVVIKNLGHRMREVQGISGGCILGDGRVGLILDVPGLIDLARNL